MTRYTFHDLAELKSLEDARVMLREYAPNEGLTENYLSRQRKWADQIWTWRTSTSAWLEDGDNHTMRAALGAARLLLVIKEVEAVV